MSFINFSLYNDISNVVQLEVFDDVDPNNKLVIYSSDYPHTSPFPVVSAWTTSQLNATALTDGGNTANIEWIANPGNQQTMTTIEDGKTYNLSNGFEKTWSRCFE